MLGKLFGDDWEILGERLGIEGDIGLEKVRDGLEKGLEIFGKLGKLGKNIGNIGLGV